MPADRRPAKLPLPSRSLGLYVLVFAVTGVVIYLAGVRSAAPPAPTASPATATTTVHWPTPSGHIRESEPAIALDADRLEKELLEPKNLGALAKRLGLPAEIDLDALRRQCTFRCQSHADAGGHEIRITSAGDNATGNVQLVNALAGQCSELARRAWQSHTQSHLATAAENTRTAGDRLQQAQAALDEFLERHFREHAGLAADVQQPSRPGPAAQAVTPKPAMVDNPQWLDVENRLNQRRQSLSSLLKDRTARHPDVLIVQDEVSALERELSQTPRQVLGQQPTVAEPAAPPVVPPDPRPADVHREYASAYGRLHAAAQAAQEGLAAARTAERTAWQRQLQIPDVETKLAVAPIVIASATPGSNRLLWMAVAAATAVSAGVGMVRVGTQCDGLVHTVGDLEAASPVPVLGVVSDANWPDESSCPAPSLARSFVWLSSGLALVAGALGSVAMLLGWVPAPW